MSADHLSESDLAAYPVRLAAMTAAELAAEVADRRLRLAVFEAASQQYGGWCGHGLMVAMLRLAERALAARPINVSGSGGANDAGKVKRRSGHARSK